MTRFKGEIKVMHVFMVKPIAGLVAGTLYRMPGVQRTCFFALLHKRHSRKPGDFFGTQQILLFLTIPHTRSYYEPQCTRYLVLKIQTTFQKFTLSHSKANNIPLTKIVLRVPLLIILVLSITELQLVGSFPLVTQASATQGSCCIPTSSICAQASNTDERERALNDLKANGYPGGLLNKSVFTTRPNPDSH